MKNHEYFEKIAKGAIIFFLGLILARGLTYLYVALVARLGSSEYGLLSLGFTITLFLSSLALVGLKSGIVRYISFYIAKKNNSKIKGTILSAIKISLPISIILMIFLFLFSEYISLTFFHNAKLIPILKLFSLIIPFIVLNNIFISMIIGFQKIQYQVGIKDILENIVKLILTFILIYFGYNLFGAAIAYVISIIFTFILSLYLIQKKIFPLFNKNIKAKLINKELFLFSFPLLFGGIFTLILKWTDVLMIGFFRTASEVGIYNVALPTANLLTIVPTALMAIFLPIITNLYSKNNKNEVKEITLRTSKWIFFLNFPFFLILFLFSESILKIMFGQEYVIGSSALIILIIGYIVHSLSHVNSSIMIMLKKTKIVFFVSMITALSNILLNLLLIPRYGIIGGAISTSFSLILSYTIYTILTYKFTKIFAIKLMYIKFIIAGILSFLVLYLLKNIIKISLINLIVLSLIFCLIYFIIAVVLKSFDKQDKDLLMSIKNKFVSKIINHF